MCIPELFLIKTGLRNPEPEPTPTQANERNVAKHHLTTGDYERNIQFDGVPTDCALLLGSLGVYEMANPNLSVVW